MTKTFHKYLNQYDVIYLNMQQFLLKAKKQNLTVYLEQAVIADIKRLYSEHFPAQETNLVSVLEQIYAETDREFIF